MKSTPITTPESHTDTLQTLEPVLIPVPLLYPHRSPQQVQQQRQSTRKALLRCAGWIGAPQNGWRKNDQNVPQPLGNYFWSVSHKRHWCGAVIAHQPVGIDIEAMLPRRRFYYEALGSVAEWDQLGEKNMHSFYRLWTAKEATLKANGEGIGKLLDCHLKTIEDDRRMILQFQDKAWRIEHFYFDHHVAAVTCRHGHVAWHVDSSI